MPSSPFLLGKRKEKTEAGDWAEVNFLLAIYLFQLYSVPLINTFPFSLLFLEIPEALINEKQLS